MALAIKRVRESVLVERTAAVIVRSRPGLAFDIVHDEEGLLFLLYAGGRTQTITLSAQESEELVDALGAMLDGE